MNDLRKTMTKEAWREKCGEHRVLVPFNTGTRTHRSLKDYKRQKNWQYDTAALIRKD